MWLCEEHKGNWEQDKKGAMGVHLDSLPHPLLGTKGRRRWSFTTQVSDSAGHSVQLGRAPKSFCYPSMLVMQRRHKANKKKKKGGGEHMPTGEIKYSSQTLLSPNHFLAPGHFGPLYYEEHAGSVHDQTQSNMSIFLLGNYKCYTY